MPVSLSASLPLSLWPVPPSPQPLATTSATNEHDDERDNESATTSATNKRDNKDDTDASNFAGVIALESVAVFPPPPQPLVTTSATTGAMTSATTSATNERDNKRDDKRDE